MKLIYRKFPDVISVVVNYLRKDYYARLRKRLKNTTPTIIASDCFGTFMYHNLGLQFRSPTINLFFPKEDFVAFVQNLEGYLDAELIQVFDEAVDYPVGELEYNSRKIRIHFMHYETFDLAKEKWNARKQLVDYSNIYIVQHIPFVSKEDVAAFDNLPYRNKMLIAGRNPTNSKNVRAHRIYTKWKYHEGIILEYKTRFSVKRYMDDIDYVSFLNGHH